MTRSPVAFALGSLALKLSSLCLWAFTPPVYSQVLNASATRALMDTATISESSSPPSTPDLTASNTQGPSRNPRNSTFSHFFSLKKNIFSTGRLASLDAFRGLIMLLMASSGLGFAEMARHSPDNPFLRFLAIQTEHASWAGCTLWDLIQPSFMFMVGAALPFSIASRQARGDTFSRLLGHALSRSLILILLAVFLTSAWSRQTEWIFTNVLAQIGLGYPFLFLLAFTRPRTQLLSVAAILLGYWLFFALYPVRAWGSADPVWQSVGVPQNWPHFTGFAAHWEKSANVATAFDRWFLNLFPREKPFLFSTGGYQTLNFIPSLATMIFGLLAGQFLRTDLSPAAKVKGLASYGLVLVFLGLSLAFFGICPLIKRIWTPSWAIYSAGAASLLLGAFFAIIEWRGATRWAFPLIVAGLNPIALYCMWQLMAGFVRENLKRHFGQNIFAILGESFVPFMERAGVLLIFWLVLFWLYRRKIFLRI